MSTINERTNLLSKTINDNQSEYEDGDLNRLSSSTNTNNGISWYFAVFLIVNAALGAGLLNFAKAFDNAGGIAISITVQLFLVVIIVGALVILAFCTDYKDSANFQDVIYSMCGKKWQTINSVCIILYMFGCCVTFFILIGDQLDQILTCMFGESALNHWYCDRRLTTTLTSFLFILPLCYPKRIDFLTYPRPEYWTDVFSVIPVICFGYQCHVNAVPIYACLKQKNLREFTKSIIASVFLVFTAYTISATFGYLTFGSKIDDDLLKSYDAKDISVLIAIIMYLFKTYTSYPLNLFCARTALEGLWIEWLHLDQETIIQYEKRRRVLIVTVWFMLSLLIAIFIPNITIVINYLGALAAAFMFVFPGLCLMFYAMNQSEMFLDSSEDAKAFKRKSNILICVAVFYITFGTFIFGLVVTQSVMKDFF